MLKVVLCSTLLPICHHRLEILLKLACVFLPTSVTSCLRDPAPKCFYVMKRVPCPCRPSLVLLLLLLEAVPHLRCSELQGVVCEAWAGRRLGTSRAPVCGQGNVRRERCDTRGGLQDRCDGALCAVAGGGRGGPRQIDLPNALPHEADGLLGGLFIVVVREGRTLGAPYAVAPHLWERGYQARRGICFECASGATCPTGGG